MEDESGKINWKTATYRMSTAVKEKVLKSDELYVEL
jgi:hypothetical protein